MQRVYELRVLSVQPSQCALDGHQHCAEHRGAKEQEANQQGGQSGLDGNEKMHQFGGVSCRPKFWRCGNTTGRVSAPFKMGDLEIANHCTVLYPFDFRKNPYESSARYKISGHGQDTECFGSHFAGLRGADSQGGLVAKTGQIRSHGRAFAHQTGLGPHGPRHPHWPHRGAQQDAPVAGFGAPSDLFDRRLHQPDRGPFGTQQHPTAAHT